VGLLLILCIAGDPATAQSHTAELSCSSAIVLPAECYRRLGLVGGVLLGAAICRHVEGPDESCTWPAVRGGIGGGVVLGLLGLLIGAQFPKGGTEPAPADSAACDTVPP
jgi:hypothetical protein